MADKRIKFAFGVHNHQPVGNFENVFDEAYRCAYKPLMDCLDRHPSIKAVLHFTGPLWDNYLESRPQWIEHLRSLVKREQVEMLSGGYYEPILVNISDGDKIAQIKKMNRVVRNQTAFQPRGMWMAERVWEPSLAKPLAMADIEYTVLDEAHFRSAGMEEKDVFGYYVTEEQGYPLSIFPINYKLRRMIPYEAPEKVIEYLRQWADESGDRLAVYADDGEKLGLWPETFHIVWESRWLDRFFDLVEKNSDWIQPVTFSEYMDAHPPAGRVYLPTASYFEMSTWALPAQVGRQFSTLVDNLHSEGKFDDYRTFFKGGFWRNFLVKYPESNRIQKKALSVSEKVQKMTSRDKTTAQEELFRGQCNCAYWHGVFGGIYLPHLRHAIQECLIRAEAMADGEFFQGMPYKTVERVDINRDLRDEVIINTGNLQLTFLPHQGGTLWEMDYKPLAVNLCDTMTRREEIYHNQLDSPPQKTLPDGEAGGEVTECLKDKLIIDKYDRNGFIDHFLGEDVTPEKMWRGDYRELGDFVGTPYEIFTSEKDDKAVLTLSRKGEVVHDGTSFKVEVEKTFFVPQDSHGLEIQYWILNDSDEDLNIPFGTEMNFSFLSRDPETNHVKVQWEEELEGEDESVIQTEQFPLTHIGVEEDLEEVTLVDGHRGYQVVIDFGQAADVWHFPIETINKKLNGFESVYQSTVVMPLWNLTIEAGDSWQNVMNLRVEKIPAGNDALPE